MAAARNRILLSLTILAVTLPAVATGQSRPTTPPGRIRSPEVSSDGGHVTFRLRAPRATAVTVWTEWDIKESPMNRETDGAEGVWSVTLPAPEPNIYAYYFNVDGVPTVDPGNSQTRPGGSPRSLLELGGADSPFAARPVTHGTVHVVRYHSRSLDTQRGVHIYTPPGYEDEQPGRNYPVLYLLHGSGDNDEYWFRLGKANLILDNLIAEGKARPMIIVMPDGHARYPAAPSSFASTGEPADATAGGGGGSRPWVWNINGMRILGAPGAFADDLLGDVIPYVEKHFRVLADPDHRAICGLSMGGSQAVAIGLQKLGTFSYVLSFSGALQPPADGDISRLVPDPQAVNRKLKLLWIGCGKQDTWLDGMNVQFVAALEKLGVAHVWHRTAGHHTWPLWRVYLNETAPLLFREDTP